MSGKKGNGCWIRVHHKPRRALFAPTGTSDGPNIALLSGVRSTKVVYGDSSGDEVIGDQWVDFTKPCQVLTKKWTGCSIFPLKQPEGLVGTSQSGSTEVREDRSIHAERVSTVIPSCCQSVFDAFDQPLMMRITPKRPFIVLV